MPDKVFRDEWEEYAIIESDGSFPILQNRLQQEAKENSARELLEIMDEEFIDAYCNDDYYDELYL